MNMRKCIYCNREIPFKYLLKQKDLNTIRCPYCTKKLKANKMSKLLGTSLMILVIAIIIVAPCNYFIKVISAIAWIFICDFVLCPLLYVYE
ncbi:hypothetical protein [Clostridium sp.]|uniref:hypothetical protein n=1 Tax=Clostridium sp. TaxID=1506 RepID=UPI002A90EF11|nr:hypothetical protein [Clostridium sp.]MDY6012349.1 hypothetical protein [Clostridium sp.]